ncbi:MAG: polysaccharide export protein [Proteobacteria bacterium]|nr:polysaccharide export protein [Pseudomonadota bacterium]MBU4470932.1 polysaccharide export protein [Pseudomonadota bacterium]MCG2751930.1 polysaccharide export protein [Desulfobacteraceae bacterium]
MKKLQLMMPAFMTLALFLSITQPSSGQETTRNQQEKNYTIGSGDVLEITTWKEPDFSREAILVRIDGKISFPLVNDIQAAGRTPVELKNEIEAKLKKFVSTPVVTVTIRIPNSQKFYILGEVKNTGEYNLTKSLTVLQAFALAGGFTEWAAKNEILLLRSENGVEKIIRINYKNIIKGDQLNSNMKIQANDTIIVP